MTQTIVQSISPRRKWGSLLVLSLALAIIIIDTTLLNVSLATIIREFQTTIQNIQWVITAYALTLAALTITGGRLGDLFGRKRMFVLGAIIFAIGSYITSISHSVPMMIMGEAIIEGVGAALMMPATASLIVSTFVGRERAIAFGVWGGVAAAASAIGPIVGGYLTTNYSWRWGFRINVLVVLILLTGSFLINESRDQKHRPSLDWIGVILSALGLLSLVFGFIESSTYGWWVAKSPFTIGSSSYHFAGGLSVVPYALLIGISLLALFLWWERRVETNGRVPLVSLKLFTNRQFTSGTLTTMVMTLGMSGMIFTLPVFLQSVKNLDAFHTGLSLLPLSVTILIVAPLSAFMSNKVQPRLVIQLGLLLNICGILLLRSETTTSASAATLAPGLILFGAGIGAIMAQVNNLTLSAVPVEMAGEAAGVSNTLRQVGSTLGSAIIGAVLLTALSTNLASGVEHSSIIPVPMKTQIAEAVSKQTSNVEFNGGARLKGSIPVAVTNEIVAIGHRATVDANRLALIYAALFGLLGFLVSLSLPKTKTVHGGPMEVSHQHSAD